MINLPQPEARPAEINRAMGLLWLGLVMGVVRTVIDWSHIAGGNLGLTLLTMGCTLAVTAFIIWKIGEGREWARAVFLVLFLVGFVPYLFVLPSDFQRAPLDAAISMAQALVQLWALWLIFAAPGGLWFKSRKSKLT